MIISLKEILKKRKSKAIGAFNVTTYENCKAIIDAATELNKPVILNYTKLHSKFMSMEEAFNVINFFAKKTPVPICIHLDHGSDMKEIKDAIHLGFSSVMFDGSSLDFEENIEKTAEVVNYCHPKNISVEAELGHILVSKNGIEDYKKKLESSSSFLDNDEKIWTNPNMAKKFVEATNVDALAISFGTAHGLYISKPSLNTERIKEIKNLIDIPLVMHGGSGLSDLQYKEVIDKGIAKINYYTYMDLAGGKAIYDYCKFSTKEEEHYFRDISLLGYEAIKKHVKDRIILFSE